MESDPTGTHGHLYASVPTDPLPRLQAMAGFGARSEEALVNDALVRARESRDPRVIAMVCAGVSDFHLERGHLQNARAVLFEGLVAATANHLDEEAAALERREAWLDYLNSQPGAELRITRARKAAQTAGLDFEVAVLSIYLALVRARRGDADTVHGLIREGLDYLRATNQVEAMARLALLASLAFQALGQNEQAQIEALRVRSLAHSRGLESLGRAADQTLSRVRGEKRNDDDRIDQLISVAIDVGRQRKLEDVANTVARSTLDLLGADRAFVIRVTPRGPRVVAGVTRSGELGRPSLSIVKRSIVEGREVVAADLGLDSKLSASASIMSMGLRTAICVPMTDGPTVVGAIYADSQKVTRDELTEAAWLVRAFAAHAVAAVRNAEQIEKANQRIQRNREANHDVRNLVSSLRFGLAELLEDAALEPWAHQLVADLQKVTQVVEKQVAESLSGEREPVAAIDFRALVSRVAEYMRFDAREKNVDITLDLESANVHGRDGDLTRLICNLVGNAIKYAPAHSIVEVSVRSTDDHAWLQVRDHGPGIPEAELDTIFVSGAQAEGHLEGYGLGLGICSRLVEEAGGAIRARNAADGGAIFEVRLPAR